MFLRQNSLILLLLLGGCGRPPVPQENLLFGIRLSEIPGGEARLGNPEGGPSEQHRVVTISPFAISVHEITNTQFCRFLNETAYAWEGSPQTVRRNQKWYPQPGFVDHPVTHVTYADAQAFCRWAETWIKRPVRLPEENEWEAAARGGINGAPYPWGWEPPDGRAVFNTEGSQPVASYSPNRFGLYDLSGNVWEWCDKGALPVPMARGGAWAERTSDPLQLHVRREFPETYRDADLGFRMVVLPSPAPLLK